MPFFQVIGTIDPPPFLTDPDVTGLTTLITNVVLLLIVIAGLYVFINIILAGYMFISSGGEPKGVAAAWAKIYQSLIGLVLVSAAILITMVISLIFFDDATFILNPIIRGPGS